jgi:flagellar biosynthetic protein FliR
MKMALPDLEQIVSAVTFTGIRVGGIMVFAPFTGSDSISAPIKAVLTLLVTVLIYPNTHLAGISADPLGWIKVAAGEAAIGLGLGLLLQFAFEAVQFAGQIFGMQTGFSLITLLDPQTEADSPSLIVFTRLMALLVFLELNVHHAILRGVSASFAYLPPGGLNDLRGLSSGVLGTAGGLWLAGLQMAGPVLAVTLVTDVALGFVGKVAPQLPATLAGIPVKNVLGLSVMGVAAGAWPHFLGHEFSRAIAQAEKVLHLAG